MGRNIIILLALITGPMFSDVYDPVQADWSYDESLRTISYKEKTYRFKTFSDYEIKFPVIFEEFKLNDWYAQDIIIDSYTSVLVDDSLGLSYYETYTDTALTHIHPSEKFAIIGARGTKRHTNFSVMEINPYYVRNDSLFFISSFEYTLIDYVVNPFLPKKSGYEKLDMAIITTNEFADNFERYRLFKTKQGFVTVIKTVEEIYSEYTGESNVMKIRNFIRDKYVSNDLKYVIIGGGYKTVPLGKALPYVSALTSEIYSDSFYSKLDGVTDSSGNGVHFEYSDKADSYEDVYVGRFPGNTEEEIDAVINKTIKYYSSDRNFRTGFNTSLLLLGMDVFNAGDGRNWCNNVRTEFSSPFVRDSIYEGVSPDFGKEKIISRFNSGYNFVYSQSHGDYHVIRQTDNEFKIWSDDIMNLEGVSGLFYIAACKPGYFGGDSFSHKAMVDPDGGCVTYIGSGAQEYPSGSNNFNAYFFRQINRKRSLGESFADAKIVFGNRFNISIIPMSFRAILRDFRS